MECGVRRTDVGSNAEHRLWSWQLLRTCSPVTTTSQNPFSTTIRLHPKGTMAPLVPIFSADSLPDHTNIVSRNFQEQRRRKGAPVNLQDCPLLEMVQYSCNPPQDGIPKPGVVVCKPVVRLFRRYTSSSLLGGSGGGGGGY